jgi:hypothetical protein
MMSSEEEFQLWCEQLKKLINEGKIKLPDVDSLHSLFQAYDKTVKGKWVGETMSGQFIDYRHIYVFTKVGIGVIVFLPWDDKHFLRRFYAVPDEGGVPVHTQSRMPTFHEAASEIAVMLSAASGASSGLES